MKSVWERDDLPPDENVKGFTNELNAMQRYRDSLIKPKEPIVKEEKVEAKAKESNEDNDPSKSDTKGVLSICLLYTSPSPRDQRGSRMPSSA